MQNKSKGDLSPFFLSYESMVLSLPRIRFIFILLILALAFSSCVEIVQEVELNKDESGSFQIRFGYGGMRQLAAYTGLNDMERRLASESRKLASEYAAILKKQEGISMVRIGKSGRKGYTSLSFKFTNYHAFNRAIYALAGLDREKPNIMKVKNGKITLRNLAPFIRRYLKRQDDLQLDLFAEFVQIKEIYRMPGKISKATRNPYYVQKNSGYVERGYSLDALMRGKEKSGIKIRFQ